MQQMDWCICDEIFKLWCDCGSIKRPNGLRRSIVLREMEKLKDPAMLLSVANSIGIVGITAYFYKQLEAQRVDLIKLSTTLTALTRKVAEMEKGEQNKGEVLHSLNNQIKEINQQVEDMASFGDIDNFDIDINEIIAVLEENNIAINRPSQSGRYRRSGDRRPPRRQDDEDRYSTSSRRATVRSSERGNTRDEIRGQPQRRDVRSRQEQRGEPSNYEDDDLINQVRLQQPQR